MIHSQICLTPCLSIISWKISPPVFPINLVSGLAKLQIIGGGESAHTIRPSPVSGHAEEDLHRFCWLVCC